jgi:hypothetical protein
VHNIAHVLFSRFRHAFPKLINTWKCEQRLVFLVELVRERQQSTTFYYIQISIAPWSCDLLTSNKVQNVHSVGLLHYIAPSDVCLLASHAIRLKIYKLYRPSFYMGV